MHELPKLNKNKKITPVKNLSPSQITLVKREDVCDDNKPEEDFCLPGESGRNVLCGADEVLCPANHRLFAKYYCLGVFKDADEKTAEEKVAADGGATTVSVAVVASVAETASAALGSSTSGAGGGLTQLFAVGAFSFIGGAERTPSNVRGYTDSMVLVPCIVGNCGSNDATGRRVLAASDDETVFAKKTSHVSRIERYCASAGYDPVFY